MKIYSSTLSFVLSISLAAILFSANGFAFAKDKNDGNNVATDRLELETLKIQGNKELPKVLFVVPWQNKIQKKGGKNEQRIVLHSLYGDLFDPVGPTNSLTHTEK